MSLVHPPRSAQSAFIVLASSLILTTLACQLQLGGPTPPSPPVTATSDSSALLGEAWASALAAATRTGELTLTIDESQLNGLVGQRLEAEANPPILQPQVFLRQGLIQIYGVSSQGLVQARVHISVRPRVNQDGAVEFEIPSAEVGPLSATNTMKEGISKLITDFFTGALGPVASGLRVTSIVISDGQMAIVATLR
jgi:hypothetical protein